MNLAPKARGEAVAAFFCAFHGHRIEDIQHGGLFKHDQLVCTQCGATLTEIRESSPAAVSASEHLKTNPE